MKHNQKILELHPHLSKLIDSLCFELAVNVPDQNSLSLLEILQMRKNGEISDEEFKELYKSWLQSKNIYDLFSAKQVKIYPKNELIANMEISQHLRINAINSYLQLLHELYISLFQSKLKGQVSMKKIKDTEDLFSYLDSEGNIHLRLSNLFFLQLAILVYENTSISNNYEAFKSYFRNRNKDLCEVEGIVCLRWFKNHFLCRTHQNDYARQITNILKDIEKNIRNNDGHARKNSQGSLPNILDQAFVRWKTTSRFTGVFESRKKKLQIYRRLFDQNQYIFFFNGGKEDIPLSQSYFIKKYGQQYIRSLQIDNKLLKEFDEIVKSVLDEYLSVVSKMQGLSNRHHKSNMSQASATHHSPLSHNQMSHQSTTTYHPTNRKAINQSYQANQKYSHNKSDLKCKDKTPIKMQKGYETKRFNVTPTNKNKDVSPFINKHFGSTEKSLSKNKMALTPTKNIINYNGTHYIGNTTQQVYRNSKKQGLQKDSFYQKLFFFRNKRVQSFDIVMRRLKGK